MPDSEWVVQRHGGASTHQWRQLYRGTDEVMARYIYKRAADKLRQGDVKLNGPDGLFEQTGAPRLRTQW